LATRAERSRERILVQSALHRKLTTWMNGLSDAQVGQLRSQFNDMLELWNLVLAKTTDEEDEQTPSEPRREQSA
jgi:hypothetical protein